MANVDLGMKVTTTMMREEEEEDDADTEVFRLVAQLNFFHKQRW